MARVRVVHWKPAAAEPLLEACRAAGHEVECDELDLPATSRKVRQTLPEALVIDLSCRPASGRELAFSLRHTKYTSHIPLVFVDGDPEKVAAIRAQMPDAVFTPLKRVAAAIARARALDLTHPAKPPSVMERYGGRTTAQKLGIKENSSVGVFDAPRDYVTVLGALPQGVELVEEPDSIHPVTLWFVRDPREYQAGLRVKRKLAPHSKFWVIWQKGSTNGLTGEFVREAAIEAGLVDYKICAVDARWSGMVFAAQKDGKTEMKGRILSRSFYDRDAVEVGRALLGKVLVHGPCAGIIVETEAYLATGDLASHAAVGITERNRVMFGPPGHAYVYLSYGMHDCTNIVVNPGCILIRALEPAEGLDLMRARRPKAKTDRDLTSGPGKLTQALAITRKLNGTDMTRGDFVVLDRKPVEEVIIDVGPRIGITKCADYPLRFTIKGNRFISR